MNSPDQPSSVPQPAAAENSAPEEQQPAAKVAPDASKKGKKDNNVRAAVDRCAEALIRKCTEKASIS